jgi:hypothetical protein
VVKQETKKQSIPSANEIWSFLSEYWLVKNAPVLKWDFEKPDYGIVPHFEEFLQKLGYYEQKFKIVLCNSPTLAHVGLPGTNEVILVLSVPFIKQLNLSLPEISILLFEDFLRVKEGYVEKKVMSPEVQAMLGAPIEKNAQIFKTFKEVIDKLDSVIFDKGFTFQEQFDITQKMDKQLKSDLNLWSLYGVMLRKIDGLVKGNLLFKSYSQIYPSPEMQLRWLGGEVKQSL